MGRFMALAAENPPLSSLRVHVARYRPQALLVLSGEIDLSTANDLRSAGMAAVEQHGCIGIVLDMADIRFMDSTGLGALVAIRNVAATLGR
jgi:anti-anti-sigma factor